MTYGRMLEKRRFGVYYFRQVYMKNGKQVVKRFSLRTTDIVIARFLALQIKAKTEMIDLNNLKKFNIEWDDKGNIKSVKTIDGQDAKDLTEFLKLHEASKAEAHKRQLETLKLQQQISQEAIEREQAKFLSSAEGQERKSLYESLQKSLNAKDDKLTPLKDSYINELTTTENTKYKYNNFITKFIAFCISQNVSNINGVDRKIVYAYLLYLRKEKKKTDNTIKNVFNTLSTFFNHLINTGETKSVNPFVGQKLDVEETGREPFTVDELEKLFSCEALQKQQKLFFICLILLTSGARPNEICQLWTDDITIEKDIIKVRITENAERDQSLKNKQSKRTIYLHPLLEKFGFIDYLKGKKLGMVFDLTKPTKKTYSTFASEDLTKILRSIGIQTKTMYCFRHTVLNRLKQAEIADNVSQDLVGHEGKTTKSKFYEQQFAAEILKNKTEKILSYEEVSLFKKLL